MKLGTITIMILLKNLCDYDYDYDYSKICNRLQSITIIIVIRPNLGYHTRVSPEKSSLQASSTTVQASSQSLQALSASLCSPERVSDATLPSQLHSNSSSLTGTPSATPLPPPLCSLSTSSSNTRTLDGVTHRTINSTATTPNSTLTLSTASNSTLTSATAMSSTLTSTSVAAAPPTTVATTSIK